MTDSGNDHHPHTAISPKDIVPFANPTIRSVTSTYMMTLTPTGLNTLAKHAMVTDTSDSSLVNTKDQEHTDKQAISSKSWKSSGVDHYNNARAIFRKLVFTVHGWVKVPSFFDRVSGQVRLPTRYCL